MLKYGLSSTGGRQAISDFIPLVFEKLKAELKDHISKSYAQFSITHDGTPGFAEVLAINIRTVSTSCQINDFLLHLGHFSKSLNGSNMKEEIYKALDSFNLSLSHWRAAHSDRAATNYAALQLGTLDSGISPLRMKSYFT